MKQKIVNFHQDEFNDWVADLACGHSQHTRHNPPWQNRMWVIDKKSREQRIGKMLECSLCDKEFVISKEFSINKEGVSSNNDV